MTIHLIGYLWVNRSRHQRLSRQWLKAWTKRILLIPNLYSQLRKQQKLSRRGAVLGDRTFVAPRARIDGNASQLVIGSGTFIGEIEIALHARVHIGKHVCINDYAKLLTGSHDIRSVDWRLNAKPITIEDYVWIATDAIILPGVSIGRGAVIGAGAVVAKSLPPGCVVTGNPARIVENQRPSDLKYSPVESIALLRAWLS